MCIASIIYRFDNWVRLNKSKYGRRFTNQLMLFQMEDCGVRERDRGQDGQDRAAAAQPRGQGRGRKAAATGTTIQSEDYLRFIM